MRAKKAAKRAAAKRVPSKATPKPSARSKSKAPKPEPVAKPRAAKQPAATWPRDAALEQAILDAPLDPVPRMVYADWLQGAGDRRGEWMALHAAIESDPKNVRLRSAAVDFLGSHLDLLLGPGKSLLIGGWIGWRAGFIDELRIQPSHKRGAEQAFASLLAHPSARFVRCIGLGDFGQAAIDVVAAAAPPLLETVVAIDTSLRAISVDIDPIAALPTIRRLGLHGGTISKPMPQLVELSCFLGGWAPAWVGRGNCENLTRLTVDCAGGLGTVHRMFPHVPRLRQLRLLQTQARDLEAITSLAGLELLDLSHGRFTDADLEPFVGWRGLAMVLHRTAISHDMLSRLTASGVTVTASPGSDALESDHQPGGWLHDRLATDGRDGLLTMPGIGRLLFNIGTHHSMHGDPKDATSLLDASLTFPNEHLKTWSWANAAIAHERLHEFDDAELIAREGLLRTPKEPNLMAIIVDALRRTDRLAEAEALLPRALASIAAKPGPGAHTGGRAACLVDVLFVLAQAGRHDEVLELADEYPTLVEQRREIHAIVAMSLIALGKAGLARTALAKSRGARFPAVIAHANAVVGLAVKRPDPLRALQFLRDAKAEPYPEWHWIAKDPNLAKLHGHPGFAELVS